MGSFSLWHWLILLAVVLVLFGGGGKISRLMGDFGKGLKSFKKNIKEESSEDDDGEEPKQIPSGSGDDASASKKDKAAKG